MNTYAQQINGREGETATFLKRSFFNSELRVIGFAPRHLNRYAHTFWRFTMHKIILICFCLLLSTNVVLAQTKDSYEKFLDQAMSDFGGDAAKINNEYDFGKYRWDYTQDSGKLIFSDKGVSKIIATAQIVGSYSTYSNTWKWSWANDTVDDAVKKDISKVKEYGEKNQYKELTTAQWKCDEDYAWKMTAAAGQLLKAKGAYRGPIPDGYVYFLITEIKRVDAKK